jgi:hypothetical protein
VKLSHADNDNLINRTLAVWTPRLGRDLSREDARELAENVIGFFDVLAEWSKVTIPANDSVAVAPSLGGPNERPPTGNNYEAGRARS